MKARAPRSANVADALLRIGAADALELLVLRVRGEEELSRLFEFEILIAVEELLAETFTETNLVGERAALQLIAHDGQRRDVRGMIGDCEYSGRGHSHVYFTLRLSPYTWLLTQRTNCRIFQDKTTPDIIRAVLADHGLAATGLHFALKEEYGPRNYCVQYRESDWDFLSRLMEEEGMYYFYRERDGVATLHITDGAHGHFDLRFGRDVVFCECEGRTPEPGTAYEFAMRRQLRPGRFSQTDYSAVKPSLPLDTQMDEAEKPTESHLELFDFPGEYRDRGLGQRLSRVRLQEARTGCIQGRGRSTRMDLAPGRRFGLSGHKLARLNSEYVVTRVRHECVTPMAAQIGYSGPGAAGRDQPVRPAYDNEFSIIPAEHAFRPSRKTQRPRMGGPQTAVVVGPEQEEIYTDKYGRVKVRFRWDREMQLGRDGRQKSDSSCWIRVSQPWAGPGFGGMAIPRIGQEVIVDFLEGDPDQPIITGRVYNGESMPPQDLPGKMVRTTIRSQTHKGKGFNEITMDDTTGEEHFYMKAQYDKTEEIGNNRNTSVGVDSVEIVGNNVTETVGNNMSTDVTNACSINCDTMLINAKTSITLQCGASRIHMNQAGFISITGTVITSAATVNNSMVAPLTEVVGAVMLTQAGAVVLVEGGATHVRGEVIAAVKGAEVNVVAGADNIIQGGAVKIN